MQVGEYECYVTVNDAKRDRIFPARLPNRDSVFTFSMNDTIIPCGIPEYILPKHEYPMTAEETISHTGLHIDKPGAYRYQLYSIRGTQIKEGVLELSSGVYTSTILSQLIGINSWVALTLYDGQQLIHTAILSPIYH